VDVLAVDLQLLRQVLLPDLKLTVGRELMARVVDIEPGGRGTLSLAGMLLEAEMPKELVAGQEIRLQVRELSADKVVLGLQTRPPELAPAVAAPLPGGGTVHVRAKDEQEGGPGGGAGGGSASHSLTITYDAPTLGAVDMHFVLEPGALRLAVTVAAGRPFEAADDGGEQLREALARVLEVPVAVSITPRYEPLDVYA
jgi:hypothetical protein